MKFEKAFEWVVGHEGGYQNDPKDRGNWTSGKVGVGERKGTKFGISAMSYPALDIFSLTLDDAKEIYKRDFWDYFQMDKLPEAVRFDVFDTAINSGPVAAAKMLQRAAKVKDDGVIGPVTLKAIKAMDPEQLDAAFAGHRLLFVVGLQTFEHYGRGWVRRVAENLIKD